MYLRAMLVKRVGLFSGVGQHTLVHPSDDYANLIMFVIVNEEEKLAYNKLL